MPKQKSYRITRIDPELFQKFKSACAFYGLDMRDVFVKYMSCIVQDYEWTLSHKVDIKRFQAADIFRLGVEAQDREKWTKLIKKKGVKKT